MVSFAAGLAGGIVVLALLFACAAKGVRDGDRPADATVSAVLRHASQPDERRPVIVATVVNPSGRPVLAGLSARPSGLPAWLAVVGPGRLRLHRLRVPGAPATARAELPVRR
jgi:hypothetical protein